MEEDGILILLNNLFSAFNPPKAMKLQGKLIGSNWVYKTKFNSDRSLQ